MKVTLGIATAFALAVIYFAATPNQLKKSPPKSPKKSKKEGKKRTRKVTESADEHANKRRAVDEQAAELIQAGKVIATVPKEPLTENDSKSVPTKYPISIELFEISNYFYELDGIKVHYVTQVQDQYISNETREIVELSQKSHSVEQQDQTQRISSPTPSIDSNSSQKRFAVPKKIAPSLSKIVQFYEHHDDVQVEHRENDAQLCPKNVVKTLTSLLKSGDVISSHDQVILDSNDGELFPKTVVTTLVSDVTSSQEEKEETFTEGVVLKNGDDETVIESTGCNEEPETAMVQSSVDKLETSKGTEDSVSEGSESLAEQEECIIEKVDSECDEDTVSEGSESLAEQQEAIIEKVDSIVQDGNEDTVSEKSESLQEIDVVRNVTQVSVCEEYVKEETPDSLSTVVVDTVKEDTVSLVTKESLVLVNDETLESLTKDATSDIVVEAPVVEKEQVSVESSTKEATVDEPLESLNKDTISDIVVEEPVVNDKLEDVLAKDVISDIVVKEPLLEERTIPLESLTKEVVVEEPELNEEPVESLNTEVKSDVLVEEQLPEKEEDEKSEETVIEKESKKRTNVTLNPKAFEFVPKFDTSYYLQEPQYVPGTQGYTTANTQRKKKKKVKKGPKKPTLGDFFDIPVEKKQKS